MKQLSLLSFYVLLFSMLLFGCGKDNEEIPEKKVPVFGTCEPVKPEGNITLSGSNNGTFTYNTSGGGKIVFNAETYVFTFTHADYPGFSVQFWGGVNVNGTDVFSAAHEDLNDKHIKDKLGDRRSIIFPDGAKATIVCADNFGALLWTSIYDGNECHYYNNTCNSLEYSSTNSAFAKQLDDAEADGETCTFEFTETGLLFLNIYTEDIAGQKVEKRVLLGELFKDDPNKVNDHYDDPRFGHT